MRLMVLIPFSLGSFRERRDLIPYVRQKTAFIRLHRFPQDRGFARRTLPRVDRRTTRDRHRYRRDLAIHRAKLYDGVGRLPTRICLRRAWQIGTTRTSVNLTVHAAPH